MFKRSRLLIGAAIPVVMLAIMMGWRMWRTPSPETFEVPLRDGHRLPVTVYRPLGEGPWPVILFRSNIELPVDPWPFARRGYVVVSQQTRRLAGDPRPLSDREDGFDTIEWLAKQPFCNGRVGIAGHAEVGYLAYLAASARPPHLASVFVSHAPASLFHEGHRVGGLFRAADTMHAMTAAGYGPDDFEKHRARGVWDEQWKAADFASHAAQVAVPVYHATAWYDPGVRGVLKAASMLHRRGLPGARGRQRVLVRPAVRHLAAGDLEFPGADVDEDMFGWFERTLQSDRSGGSSGILYYLSGPVRTGFRSQVSGYRATDRWPPAGATPTRLYLGPKGRLEETASQASTSTSGWSPVVVPTVGGRHVALTAGPANLAILDGQPGVVRFASSPLTDALTIVGDVSLDIFLAANSGDVIARLADVYPDGYAAWIAEGALRPADDGEATKRHRIDLGPVAVVIGAEHRLALYLTSTSRPALDPDPNPGVHRPILFHDEMRPSAVVLPVLPAIPPKADR